MFKNVYNFLSLSIGDFRMTVGEDKNKIINILKSAVPEFKQLYSPFINKYLTLNSDGSYTVNVSIAVFTSWCLCSFLCRSL